MKLCLKFLRELGLNDCFELLLSHTKVPLENPIVSELHSLVVEAGDFEGTEDLMAKAVDQGYMEEYVSNQSYSPVWERVVPKSACKTF